MLFMGEAMEQQFLFVLNILCYNLFFFPCRKSLEKNGNKSDICWGRFHKKTTKIWTIYKTNGKNISLKSVNWPLIKTNFTSYLMLLKQLYPGKIYSIERWL